MNSRRLSRKFGVVILLDALGASDYSAEKIKAFLSSREEINSGIKHYAKQLSGEGVKVAQPGIYTFGDTIVVTMPIRQKGAIVQQIFCAVLMMRRYLFHFLDKGVLFRGAFSIGEYVEDTKSNTVMGEAISDAAEWYEQSDWMGITSTPKTNSVLEYYMLETQLSMPRYLLKYPAPLKDRQKFELYTISWPGCFYDKDLLKKSGFDTPRKWFLQMFKEFTFPARAAMKFENTKSYFNYAEQ